MFVFVFNNLGIDQEPSYPGEKQTTETPRSAVSYVFLIGGCIAASSLVAFGTYYVHSRWWYIEYLVARRRTQQVYFLNCFFGWTLVLVG